MKLSEIIDGILFMLIMFGLLYSLKYAHIINRLIIEMKGGF